MNSERLYQTRPATSEMPRGDFLNSNCWFFPLRLQSIDLVNRMIDGLITAPI